MTTPDPRNSTSAPSAPEQSAWAPPGPGRADGATPAVAPQGGAWGPSAAGPAATQPGRPVGPVGFMHPTFTPVPWNRRALSYLIDFGVQMLVSLTISVGLIVTMIHMFSTQARSGEPTPASMGAFIIWDVASFLALIPMAYFQVYQRWIKGGPTGQSLGRRIAKTRLIDARTGQPIGIGMTIVRDVAHTVDSLPLYLGYLWPLWDKQRRTFADMLLNTVVVDEKDAPLHVVR